LALDRLNTTPRVIDIMGYPIRTRGKNTYIGSIEDHVAKFEVACTGPKGKRDISTARLIKHACCVLGEGTMYAQAMKPKTKNSTTTDFNSAWHFTHLSLCIKGHPKRIHLLDIERK
jgi:hypothetical protein